MESEEKEVAREKQSWIQRPEFKCNKEGLIFLDLVMSSSVTLEKGDSRE